jgi:hypothetical protein
MYNLSMEATQMITKSTIEQGLRHYQQTADRSANDACEYVACALRNRKDSLSTEFLTDAKVFLASARNEELNENYEQCFRDLFAAVDAMFSLPVAE